MITRYWKRNPTGNAQAPVQAGTENGGGPPQPAILSGRPDASKPDIRSIPEVPTDRALELFRQVPGEDGDAILAVFLDEQPSVAYLLWNGTAEPERAAAVCVAAAVYRAIKREIDLQKLEAYR